MINIMLRATGFAGLLFGTGICVIETSHAQSGLPALPLSVKDEVPYIEDIKIGMSAVHVKQALMDTGYAPTVRGGVVVGYKKGKASIMVSRNPNVPIKSIKYQVSANFDLLDPQINYQQKKKYIDMFKSFFPGKSSCRLTKNINAPAFCKYAVMHQGKLKYRVVLQIVNVTIKLKYSGS